MNERRQEEAQVARRKSQEQATNDRRETTEDGRSGPQPSTLNPQLSSAASPIADLSYRSYDGPLHTRAARFWIVALATIRQVPKKKGFWVVAAISLLPFVFLAFALYMMSLAPDGAPQGPFMGMLTGAKGQRYATTFFTAYGQQGLWLFIISLMVGAGSIAADNRANALLVYLSKPITKGDYLLGKWTGIFVVLYAVALAPALLLYLYCLLSFTSEGFLRDEPLLILRLLLAAAVPAALHAGLLVGISAWSKTPRMAGAAYAGLYFVSNMIATAYWGIRYHGRLAGGILERHLSIGGIIDGLGQNIFGVTLNSMAGSRRRMMMGPVSLPPPDLWVMLGLFAALILVGVLLARARIRAVEVVRG